MFFILQTGVPCHGQIHTDMTGGRRTEKKMADTMLATSQWREFELQNNRVILPQSLAHKSEKYDSLVASETEIAQASTTERASYTKIAAVRGYSLERSLLCKI